LQKQHSKKSNGILRSLDIVKNEGSRVIQNAQYIVSEIDSLSLNDAFRSKSLPLYRASFDYIFPEARRVQVDSEYISSSARSFEITRYVWFWGQIMITMVSFSLCMFGYHGSNKEFMIGGLVLIFMWFITLLCHLAFSSSEFFLVLDICENIFDIIHNNYVPYSRKGLAYFLTPFSYENKARITTQLYNATQTFDSYMYSLRTNILQIAPLATQYVNTRSELQFLCDNSEPFKPLCNDYGESIQKLENIIYTLYDLKYYRHLIKTSQDLEYPLCHKVISKFPYHLFGVMIMIVSNLAISIAFLRMLTIRNRMDHDAKKERKI